MRYLFAVFFFLSLLFSLPDHSQAALPAGVYQTAAVVGTAVATGGVSSIIPASATAGVPAVGTASSASATVSTGVAVPLLVGGVALAGGYYVGGMLATDLHNLYEAATNNPDDYPNLKDALSQDAVDGAFPEINPPVGSVITANETDGTLTNYITASTFTPATPWGGSSSGTALKTNWPTMKGMKVYQTRLYYIQYVRDYDATKFVYQYWSAYTSGTTTAPPTAGLPDSSVGGPLPVAEAISNITNPDGSLKPEIQSEVNNAIASGAASPTGITGTDSFSGQAITPEWIEALGRRLAAQNATDLARDAVTAAETAVATNTDPALDADLARRLADAQRELADAQREQAEIDQAAQTAADTAQNLPKNTYDTTIQAPEKKNISTLLQSAYSNSPLTRLLRSFTFTIDDPKSVIYFGTFYGQDIIVDFARWQDSMVIAGSLLLAATHMLSVVIIFKS